jgi:hypothetical protein
MPGKAFTAQAKSDESDDEYEDDEDDRNGIRTFLRCLRENVKYC